MAVGAGMVAVGTTGAGGRGVVGGGGGPPEGGALAGKLARSGLDVEVAMGCGPGVLCLVIRQSSSIPVGSSLDLGRLALGALLLVLLVSEDMDLRVGCCQAGLVIHSVVW